MGRSPSGESTSGGCGNIYSKDISLVDICFKDICPSKQKIYDLNDIYKQGFVNLSPKESVRTKDKIGDAVEYDDVDEIYKRHKKENNRPSLFS